jgi:hypothetical protein
MTAGITAILGLPLISNGTFEERLRPGRPEAWR